MKQSTRLGLSRYGGGVVKGEEKEEEMRNTSDGAVYQARVEWMQLLKAESHGRQLSWQVVLHQHITH